MTKIEDTEDLIDLGELAIETKGNGQSLNPDSTVGQFYPKIGMSAD